MAFGPHITTLRDVLVDLYPTDTDVRTLLGAVGVPKGRINFTGVAVNTWFSALDEADKQGMVGDIVKGALKAVSYTHLDVYKRQPPVRLFAAAESPQSPIPVLSRIRLQCSALYKMDAPATLSLIHI